MAETSQSNRGRSSVWKAQVKAKVKAASAMSKMEPGERGEKWKKEQIDAREKMKRENA